MIAPESASTPRMILPQCARCSAILPHRALLTSLNSTIAGMRDNSYGHYNYDFVFDDDVFYPG